MKPRGKTVQEPDENPHAIILKGPS
jgi:hypothetical protein